MSKARKLDRKRPFAEIFGNHEAKFEQFGILFDVDERELPGHEHIEIPEDKTVVIVAGDEEALHARIKQLEEDNARLDGILEDLEAEKEEALGKVDTLEIEVKRLQEQLKKQHAEVPSAEVPAGGDQQAQAVHLKPAGKNAGKNPAVDPNSVEGQLELQDKA